MSRDNASSRKQIGGSEHVSQFGAKDPEGDSDADAFAWEFEGRHLGLTWWGGYGIGANDWREAAVSLLFDDYHLPRHVLIAITQGLMQLPAIEGPLATMTAPNSQCDEVTTIQVGHLLRRMKQMALRGRSRHFDEDGVYGPQKLLVTGDFQTLVQKAKKVFPGARLGVERAPGQRRTRLEQLLAALFDHSLPSPLSTCQVGELLGVSWGNVSKDLTGHKSFVPLLEATGLNRTGIFGGSYF